MKLKVVELFAGVGGFRVGLNKVTNFNKKTNSAIENDGNWDFVWANQWEPSTSTQAAFNCYVTRFGNQEISNEDISKVDKKNIPNHDLLVGGFPCQDYSVARSTSNEMGIQGKKGVLWWDIAEIVNVKKPKALLLENVDRLLKSPSNQRGRDFAIMLKSLDKLGYITQWRMINAGEYNMPQRRKRVFILATRKDISYSQELINHKTIKEYLVNDGFFNELFPISNKNIKDIKMKDLNIYMDEVETTKKYTQQKFLMSGVSINGKVYNFDIIEESSNKTYTLNEVVKNAKKVNSDYNNYFINSKDLKKWEYLKSNKRIPRIKPNGEPYFYSEGKMAYPDYLDKPGRTMLTSEATVNRSSHIILHDEEKQVYRKITEEEAEVLQMFPAGWTNTGMTSRQRYFMMGNALVTGVVSTIEGKLARILKEL